MMMMNMNGMFGSGKNNTSGKNSGKGSGDDFVGSSSAKGSGKDIIGSGSGKGMGMMMNMGSNATESNLLQALEEDIIRGGKGGMSTQQGNSTSGGKGGMTTDSNSGGKGAQRDKRGPEGLSMGMMKSSESDMLSSSMPPKSMRMFRQGKNGTSPSTLMHSIMHMLHHSNVSVDELNHTSARTNTTETNSTIGNLMERFRKGLNQGFHHGHNNTTASNSSSSHTQFSHNEPDDENEDKFPRLSYLWNMLVQGVSSDNVTANETSMIGTKMWKWFNEKN